MTRKAAIGLIFIGAAIGSAIGTVGGDAGVGVALAAEGKAEAPSATGAVAGTITYRGDAARPWRYARYYVQRNTDALGETVVALKSRNAGAVFPRTPPQSLTIDQENFQFTPETTTLTRGDTVRFTNSDAATHNVRSSEGIAEFNVTLTLGDEFSYTFDRAGGGRRPVRLGCVYHSNMQAWIFVFDHPLHTITGKDGRFRIDGVPPDVYDVEVVHPAGELRWTGTATVTAGQAATLDIQLSPDDKPPSRP